ncbi:MAG: DUF1684 domain-containing protein [Terriglobales bacterium]
MKKFVGLFLLVSLVAAATPAVDPAYQKSFDEFKAARVASLKKNWLTLAGLFWLKPGDNSFGADPASAVLFPKGPAHAGVFYLQGEEVTAKFFPDSHAVIEGKPATTAVLQPDTSENRTTVEMGSLVFYSIKRGTRIGIRLKDLDSEAARKLHDLSFYPPDLSYRVTAKWLPSDGKKTVDVPNVLGDVEQTPIAGTAVFTLNGHEYQLTDLGGDASKGLFIVFNDLTSKTATYPGGRFLDTDPVVNGTVVLDFNRAYSPPCAVTPYATCPLAPKENRLPVAITAGEKYDHSHGHH